MDSTSESNDMSTTFSVDGTTPDDENDQNVLLCMLLAFIGGLLVVSGTVLVARLSEREKANSRAKSTMKRSSSSISNLSGITAPSAKLPAGVVMITKTERIVTTLLFWMLNMMGQILFTIATWYGPVSIFNPTVVATKLLLNIVLLGVVMKFEKFDKASQVATINILMAVAYLPLVGPAASQAIDYGADPFDAILLQNVPGMVWLGLLLTLYIIAISFMLGAKDLTELKPQYAELILFSVHVLSSTLANTVSKFSGVFDDVGIKAGLIIARLIVINGLWTVGLYHEPKTVRSMGKFTPLALFGTLVSNGITGIIVWRDDLVMQSWPGYGLSFSLILSSIYLMSDMDIFLRYAPVEGNLTDQIIHQLSNAIPFWSNNSMDGTTSLSNTSHSVLSKHQVIISRLSMRDGFKRGVSDPEIGLNSVAPSHYLDSTLNSKRTSCGDGSSVMSFMIDECHEGETDDDVESMLVKNRPAVDSNKRTDATHSFLSMVRVSLRKLPIKSTAAAEKMDFVDSTTACSLASTEDGESERNSNPTTATMYDGSDKSKRPILMYESCLSDDELVLLEQSSIADANNESQLTMTSNSTISGSIIHPISSSGNISILSESSLPSSLCASDHEATNVEEQFQHHDAADDAVVLLESDRATEQSIQPSQEEGINDASTPTSTLVIKHSYDSDDSSITDDDVEYHA